MQQYALAVVTICRLLRRDLQRGIVDIPGASNPKHMNESISIFDYELSDENLKRIATLNRNKTQLILMKK